MKRIIALLCFILVLATVTAQPAPPVTQTVEQSKADSLIIVYPTNQIYKNDVDFYLNFDILDHNLSRLDNTTTTCVYSIIQEDGVNIGSGNLIYDTTLKYWYKNFNLNDSTYIYEYYVYCNNTAIRQNGYLNSFITVTSSGHYHNNNNAYISIPILLIGFIFFLLYMTRYINETDEEGNIIPVYSYLRMIFIALAGFSAFILILMVVAFTDTLSLPNQIARPLYVLYQLVLWCFAILGILYIVMFGINIFYGLVTWAIEQFNSKR